MEHLIAHLAIPRNMQSVGRWSNRMWYGYTRISGGAGNLLPLLRSGKWRRERDSNPRCRYKRHTRFPVVLLRPARTSLRFWKTCGMRGKEEAERVVAFLPFRRAGRLLSELAQEVNGQCVPLPQFPVTLPAAGVRPAPVHGAHHTFYKLTTSAAAKTVSVCFSDSGVGLLL